MSTRPYLIKDSYRLGWALLREQFGALAAIFILSTASSIVLEDRLLELTRNEDGQRVVLQVGMGLLDLIGGIALFIVLSWGIPKLRHLTEAHYIKQPFTEGNYLSSFLAEYFRTLGSVLLWGILLIVPGFVRYCRLIFVPYVALFARPYREDQADAFVLARKLTVGRMPLLLGALVVSTIAQVAVAFLPQLVPDLHSIPFRLAFAGVSDFLSVWLYAFLFLHFDRAMEEFEW